MNKLISIIALLFYQLVPCYTFAESLCKESASSGIVGLILTWQQDPSTTMTIDWHTDSSCETSVLEYKKVGPPEWEIDINRDNSIWRYVRVSIDEWKSIPGEKLPFPYSKRIIHRVELTGLEPDTEYFFRIGETFTKRKFKTMPKDANRPIRFLVGGDVRHNSEWMEQMNRQAASYEPYFIVWGGDLAYADARQDLLYRWHDFMEIMANTLITHDGRMIPVLAGIGNHEVLPRRLRDELPPYSQNDAYRELIAPYYYSLFAFPGQPGYGVMDFGDYLSILLLDTGHANPVGDEQTNWLESIIAERQNVPHVFPIYHVPAYPSVRPFDGDTNVQVREFWVPLFEKYGIKIAFENHDHSYKRTYPIRNGKIQSDGVVYIGDGAWGVMTREIGRHHETLPWYIKRGSPDRHFIIATIHGIQSHFLVINENGKIIDEYPRTPHTDIDGNKYHAPLIHNN